MELCSPTTVFREELNYYGRCTERKFADPIAAADKQRNLLLNEG